MSFIKKLANLFKKKNQGIEVADENTLPEDEATKINNASTQSAQDTLEILQSAKEGEVEDNHPITKTPQKVSFTSAGFKEIAENKYFDKRKRLAIKYANLQANITKAEIAKASTDDRYLIGLAEKDIAGQRATLVNIDSLLNNVTAEDFVVAMAHKSKIESISLLQKLLAKMKKEEREALASMSSEVREMIKGCRAILPGDIDETAKAIEDKIVE